MGKTQMQLALNNRTETIFEFGLPFIIVLKEQITVTLSVRSCIRFLQDSFT